jgi:hypothetical protein
MGKKLQQAGLRPISPSETFLNSWAVPAALLFGTTGFFPRPNSGRQPIAYNEGAG